MKRNRKTPGVNKEKRSTSQSAREQTKPDFVIRRIWLVCSLAIVFLAYLPTLHYSYVYDDIQQIVNNSHIQSWAYFPDYFSKHLWSQDTYFSPRFYRPLFLLWLRLNDALFGLNASYWHLTTILSHLLATYLVYLVVRLLIKSWTTAVISALIFGLHPIHVQVAAWISAVDESLMAVGLLASFVCYLIVRDKNKWWRIGSLIFYVSALLVKETAMVFPLFLSLYVWFTLSDYDHRERIRRLIDKTYPYLLITATYIVVRIIILHNIAVVSTPLTASSVVFTLPKILLFYARLLIWPVELSPLYYTPLLNHPVFLYFFVPSLVIAIILLAAAVILYAYRPITRKSEAEHEEWTALIMAFAWGIVFMLPALYLPSLQDNSFVQDRYLYVPSIGISIIAAIGITRIGRLGRPKIVGLPWPQASFVLLLIVLMLHATLRESQVWRNNVTLFTRATYVSPENKEAQGNLAAAYSEAGQYDQAISLFSTLLNRDPNDYIANNDLAQAYLKKGDRVSAEAYLSKACHLRPTPGGFYQLGAVRYNLGRMDSARDAFEQAISLNPDVPGYHFALGAVFERLGALTPAIAAFQSELAVNPRDDRAKTELTHLESAGSISQH
jgi:protein O-mannosyl-transferase